MVKKSKFFIELLAHPIENSWPNCTALCQNVRRPTYDTALGVAKKTKTADGSVGIGVSHQTRITSLTFWPTL